GHLGARHLGGPRRLGRGPGGLADVRRLGASQGRGRRRDGSGRWWRGPLDGGGRGGSGRSDRSVLLRLLRLHVAPEAELVCLPPNAVSLGVLDGARMALHADAEVDREVEGLLVREPELSCQLVHTDLLRRQVLPSPLLGLRRCAGQPVTACPARCMGAPWV
ncbi:MAG: hypothetical protein AVDCRST_MAG76-134, partial [uncultured Acidimicrobiales bacterium]